MYELYVYISLDIDVPLTKKISKKSEESANLFKII